MSRREAREARKKLKKLKGNNWKSIPAADRLVLKATADARVPLRIEILMALLATLIVAVAGAAIAYGAFELGPAIRAATGAGTRGSFVADRMACKDPGCHWDGLFESASQNAVLRSVGYADADPAMREGTVVPALYPGSGDLVYAPRGSAGWVEPVVYLLLGTATFAAMLWYGVVRRVRRRLRNRQIRRDLQVGLGPS